VNSITWYEYRFEVSGRSRFPIDMLRVECCYPDTAADAAAIESSLLEVAAGQDGLPVERAVSLVCLTSRSYWRPAEDLWRARGWTLRNTTRSLLVRRSVHTA